MSGVTAVDLATIVRLVASAADPTTNTTLDGCRHNLMSAVGEAIGADAWVCAAGQVGQQSPARRSVQPTNCGWTSTQERDAVLELLAHPLVDQILHDAAQNGSSPPNALTRCGCDLMIDESAPVSPPDVWRSLGVADVLISVYLLEPGTFSMAGCLRRVGGAPFTERERIILHYVFQHVPWLHTGSQSAADAESIAQLSKREREVLQLLLEGHARKEVASRLNLSTHTVADYLKVIHKKLGVTSRAELLARFIPGR
jgi:DNA-binding CsgD family transcriptional regulator